MMSWVRCSVASVTDDACCNNLSISNAVVSRDLLFRWTLLSCNASPHVQPACLAFRIYLANNIGLLIMPRYRHLSSSWSFQFLPSSSLCRCRPLFVTVKNRISGWIMIAGCRRTILARTFLVRQEASLQHCIRDVHLNRRSIGDRDDVD